MKILIKCTFPGYKQTKDIHTFYDPHFTVISDLFLLFKKSIIDSVRSIKSNEKELTQSSISGVRRRGSETPGLDQKAQTTRKPELSSTGFWDLWKVKIQS